MTDYDAFAAEYDGDELAGAFAADASVADAGVDDPASEPSVLGEPPALDDATWDAMLDTAFSAEPAGDDLLAEFAASITEAIEGIVHGLEDFFHGFEVDPDAEVVDLDGDGIPDDQEPAVSGDPQHEASADLDGDGRSDEQPDAFAEASADEHAGDAFADEAWTASDDGSLGAESFDDGLADDSMADDGAAGGELF